MEFEEGGRDEKTHAILSYMHAWRIARPPAHGLLKHEARQSDVIITTFPKAGTTLVQQMSYQVLVASGRAPRGDPKGEAFTDICDVAPWVNFSPEIAEGFETNPRLYKSHSSAEVFNIGAQRHLVVLRDPASFPASWLDFMADNYAPDVAQRMYDLGRPLFDVIFSEHILGTPGLPDHTLPLPIVDRRWFHFVSGWLEHAHRNDVLFLFYEDIIANPAVTANMIASFIGVDLPQDALPTIVHRCSREYMAEGTKFKSIWDARVLRSHPSTTKVQTDRRRSFAHFSLSDEQKTALATKMKETFKFDSYAQFKSEVSQQQREKLFTMDPNLSRKIK